MGQTPQAPPPQATASSGGGLAPNVAALLGYLIWILAIVWLVVEPFKNNRYIRFHALQAIGYAVAVFVIMIAAMILSIILAFIPYIGAVIAMVMWPVLWLGFLAIWVVLMVKAYNNQMWKLPVIGDFAEKTAGPA